METENEKIERSLVCALIMLNIVGMWSFYYSNSFIETFATKKIVTFH